MPLHPRSTPRPPPGAGSEIATRRPATARRRRRHAVCLAAGLAGLLSVLLALAVGTSSPAHAARAHSAIDARDELAVKSAFVYNFAARHVKWPEAAFKDKSSPFVIGVLGRDPIAAVLTETCKGRRSGERPIEVRVLEPDGASDCQLLFVPAGREAEVPALSQALKDKPVLIVAESEAAVRRGAHLGFFLENARVRFAAHPASARQAGIEVSSELLKLARVVERRAEDQP